MVVSGVFAFYCNSIAGGEDHSRVDSSPVLFKEVYMMSHKRRLNQLEKDLNEVIEDGYFPPGISRVQYWKEVLQGRREDPERFYPNVKRSDMVCQLIARKDLDLEIPEELQEALEEELSMYKRLSVADWEASREEILQEKRRIPADWDFEKITKGF